MEQADRHTSLTTPEYPGDKNAVGDIDSKAFLDSKSCFCAGALSFYLSVPAIQLLHLHQTAVLLCRAIIWENFLNKRLPKSSLALQIPLCFHSILKKMTKRIQREIYTISPQLQQKAPIISSLYQQALWLQSFPQSLPSPVQPVTAHCHAQFYTVLS